MNRQNQDRGNDFEPSAQEQHSAVHRLAKCISKWVAYEDNDGHTIYAYQIVLNAVECSSFPSAINEVMGYLESFPISFEHLLRSLYSLSPGTENEWQEIGQTLTDFYDPRPYHKKESTWRLDKEVKPLEVVCRNVENDIERLKSQLREQKEILEKLKMTGKCNAPLGYRKMSERAEKPTVKVVEEAKQRSFTRIYQRTRELCRYEDETTHFYHAFKLVELFYGIIERDVVAYTLFERQRKATYFAEKIEELTRIYAEPLEDILKFIDSTELITLVLRQVHFSNSTHKVLSLVWHNLKQKPVNLDYEQTQGRLTPLCMGNLMLGPHVYKLMRARRVIADDLHSVLTRNARSKKNLLESMQKTGER